MEHTKGPWKISSEPLEICDSNNVFVASVEGEIPTPQDAANARLIASAPDLLEELESMVEILSNPEQYMYEGSDTPQHRIDCALRIIAKAKAQ